MDIRRLQIYNQSNTRQMHSHMELCECAKRYPITSLGLSHFKVCPIRIVGNKALDLLTKSYLQLALF